MLNNPKELKERILLASIEEFGLKGYVAASTNDIVKNAGVSKGLLFHYYKNKENLFFESIFYLMMNLGNYMEERIDFSNMDLFERIKHAMKIKMEFCCKNPIFLGLMENAWYQNKKTIPRLEEFFDKNLDEFRTRIIWDKFYNNLDTGNIRNDLDVYKIVDHTSLVIEALWQRFVKRYNEDIKEIINNIDIFVAEADEIINLIKYGALNSN